MCVCVCGAGGGGGHNLRTGQINYHYGRVVMALDFGSDGRGFGSHLRRSYFSVQELDEIVNVISGMVMPRHSPLMTMQN